LPSLTIENYTKTIYQICSRQQDRPAATGQIAEALGVAPGTVTSMLKTLAETGLAQYTPYEGVNLTETGRTLALRVLRRHRLLELFLVRTLDFSWDEVHDEAEHLEHAVSDRLVDRIDAFLDYPETDPHGDPIPTAAGVVKKRPSFHLADWEAGRPFRLVRVLDQSSEFLRYLSETGLPLGAEGEVVAARPEAGVVTVCFEGKETTMARETAEKLLVEPVESS
jgi:DtxR family transcriptional regulator, Mn-dependent transcriptional regulator